jgi:hypothetical protein
MDIHILDWVMYFVIIFLYYGLISLLGGDYEEGLGGIFFIVGGTIVITIIYLIIFWGMGVDWSEIFAGNYESWLKFKL